MSEVDENQIHDRLKRLAQIEPSQDAAERAKQRVRDTLLSEEAIPNRGTGFQPVRTRPGWPCHVFSLKAAFRRRVPPNGAKLAAAVVLIAAGVVAARLSAPPPIDVEELRADLEASLKSSLEPAIRRSVLDEADRRWQSVFAAGCAQLKDELGQQVRRDLTQFAAQSLTASGVQTQRQLSELIQLIEAARIQDRRNVEAALEHIESQFGNGLVTLAAHTNELQRPE
jgi:hypothetical protein